MKKYLTLFLFLFVKSLPALYIGSPATPSLIYEGVFISDLIPVSLRVGFVGDFLFDKKFTFPNTGFKNSCVEGNFYSGQAIVNFFDRLDIGLSAGGANLEFSSNLDSISVNEKSDSGYVVKAHAKLIIFHVKRVTFSFDGNYTLAKAKKNSFLDINNNAWFRLRQWQASFSLGTKFGFFYPYFGGVYNSSRFKISQIGSFSINGMEKENLGVFLGGTFSTNSYFLITAEGQLYSEVSFGINAQLRF